MGFWPSYRTSSLESYTNACHAGSITAKSSRMTFWEVFKKKKLVLFWKRNAFQKSNSRLCFYKMQHKPFCHMHKLRNCLKRNHFKVRCKLSLRPYLEALCQGTELVVCLLLPTNKHHVNKNAQISDMTNTWRLDLENPLSEK